MSPSHTSRTVTVLLFLAIAVTAWLLMREGQKAAGTGSHNDVVLNPGYQHSRRLQVATARAAMDAIGMTSAGDAARLAAYRADYRLQRMQMQADSLGLERWAPNDPRRQGLLLEIRASLAGLLMALDQSSDAATAVSTPAVPLLPALSRAERALSNYCASLSQPANLQRPPYLFSLPVRLWWLLTLLLGELAVLAWLVFSTA